MTLRDSHVLIYQASAVPALSNRKVADRGVSMQQPNAYNQLCFWQACL